MVLVKTNHERFTVPIVVIVDVHLSFLLSIVFPVPFYRLLFSLLCILRFLFSRSESKIAHWSFCHFRIERHQRA